jgi:RNA polymerase sigma-70 factor (ECF subfamily)
VQDALVAALKTWPYSEFPKNPRAWLIETAKNKMLDRIRRDKNLPHDEIESAENLLPYLNEETDVYFANEISEDQLRMIFACCHPAIPPDSQVALTLKIVSGFSISEIAHAFLAKDDAITKMINRAKQKLRENGIQLEMPQPGEIPGRLEAVAKVLYLMFNEGYSAFEGTELIRKDLCYEAIRLCTFLARHNVTNTPKINALAALFLFQGARLTSRYDSHGELLILAEQDRELWDKEMLGRALHFMMLSASGDELSNYHLEAEIASAYALAETYDDTQWHRILECYELLEKRNSSPIVELNKIIVMGKIHGAQFALAELDKFEEDHKLKEHNLFHVTQAHFEADIGKTEKAIASYQKAIALTRNKPVQRFLKKKIELLSSK